jgi:hypothetical protein
VCWVWDGHTLQAVEPLLKIKNKHGFKLTVKIHQHRIRMVPLQRIFEAFCQDAGPHPLRHAAKKERIINEH